MKMYIIFYNFKTCLISINSKFTKLIEYKIVNIFNGKLKIIIIYW